MGTLKLNYQSSLLVENFNQLGFMGVYLRVILEGFLGRDQWISKLITTIFLHANPLCFIIQAVPVHVCSHHPIQVWHARAQNWYKKSFCPLLGHVLPSAWWSNWRQKTYVKSLMDWWNRTKRLSPGPCPADCFPPARGSIQLYRDFASSLRGEKTGNWAKVRAREADTRKTRPNSEKHENNHTMS